MSTLFIFSRIEGKKGISVEDELRAGGLAKPGAHYSRHELPEASPEKHSLT
jgi:hypothetical protein